MGICLFSDARSPKLDQEVENVSGKIRPGDKQDIQKRISLLVLIISLLTIQWMLSFCGQTIFPNIPHTVGFVYYMLSVIIVFLIIVKFLSQLLHLHFFVKNPTRE